MVHKSVKKKKEIKEKENLPMKWVVLGLLRDSRGTRAALWLVWALTEVAVNGGTSVSGALGSLGASWVRAARAQNWP